MPDLRHQYSSEYPTVTDVTSRFLDNLVVLWSDSSDMTFSAMGFKVTQAVRWYERITSINQISENGTVDFGHFVSDGHTSLGGSDEDDRLRVGGGNAETVLEFGLGVEEETGSGNLLVGVENPADADIQGAQGEDKTRAWGESDLDLFSERSVVEADWTTTDVNTPGIPTTATAPHPNQGHIRWDSESSGDNEFFVAFEETSGNTVTPDVHALGLAYHVVPVHAPGKVRSLLNKEDNQKRRIVQYGGWGNTGPEIPEQWQSGVIEVDNGEIRDSFPPAPANPGRNGA